MAFEYKPLVASTSVPILKVLPERSDDNRVQVELWEEADTVPYRCLSYTWGDPLPMFPIQVNGYMMQAGKNLHGFLVFAAQRYSNQTFWIEAACIDPSNDPEKSIQVQRMGNNLKQAGRVLVWLSDDQDTAEFLVWVNGPESKALYYPFRKRIPKHLEGAAKVFTERLYWTRAWIVQMVILARSIRLVCSLVEADPAGLKKYAKGPLERTTLVHAARGYCGLSLGKSIIFTAGPCTTILSRDSLTSWRRRN